MQLFNAQPAREFVSYPKNPHHSGEYFFAQTGQMVAYEVMFEYTAYMWLDYSTPVRAIAAQPMYMGFGNGLGHYPDALYVHGDGDQVVYNVKPSERMDADVEAQFAACRAVCAEVGWRFEVFDGLPPIVVFNLEFLARYRHSRNAPTARIHRYIVTMAAHGALVREFIAAARKTDAYLMPALWHLAWKREIRFDEAARITENTAIWLATV